MIQKSSKRDGGFSLVEVMVAILILAVGLLSVGQLMIVATRSNALSERVTSSASLAKDTLERLKATPFYVTTTGTRQVNPSLQAGKGSVDSNVAGYFQFYDATGQPTTDAGDAMFVVRWKVEVAGGPKRPLAMVKITVRSLSAQGQYQLVGESTFVTYRTANVSAS